MKQYYRTKHRRLVLSIIAAQPQITTNQIHQQLLVIYADMNQEPPSLLRLQLYRTVRVLTEIGVAFRVKEDGIFRYCRV